MNKGQHLKWRRSLWITTGIKHEGPQRDALIREKPERWPSQSSRTAEISRIAKRPRMNTKEKNKKLKRITKKFWPSHIQNHQEFDQEQSSKIVQLLNQQRSDKTSTDSPPMKVKNKQKHAKCCRGIPKGHQASDRAPMHPIQTERFLRARQALSHFGPSAKGQNPPATHQRI